MNRSWSKDPITEQAFSSIFYPELGLFIFFTLVLTSFISQAEPEVDKQPKDSILLTVFLKHDHSKNLDEIQDILKEQVGQTGLIRPKELV